MSTEVVGARHWETGFANWFGFEGKVDQRLVFVGPRHRPDPKRFRGTSAQDDPFPAPGADQAPGRVGEAAHGARPKAEASRAKAAFQLAGSSNWMTSKPRSSSGCKVTTSASSKSAAT